MFNFPDNMPEITKYWNEDEQKEFIEHINHHIAISSNSKEIVRSGLKLVDKWEKTSNYTEWYQYQDCAYLLDVQKRLARV